MREKLVAISLAVAAGALGACDARSLVPDAGGGAGTSGNGGAGGAVCLCTWNDALSDFDEPGAAMIVQSGTPLRNGYWYTYNDEGGACLQDPMPGTPYLPEVPPSKSPASGNMALHGLWSSCNAWGAGIGADINTPVSPDGSRYVGPKVAYDLTPYKGITFWAMATPGTDVNLRVKLPMLGETRVEDGGKCVEVASHKCSDNWGERFTLPTDGAWKQITVRFSDPAFVQEGWGAEYSWNPTDVTSIRIQSVDTVGIYDFWIDDLYLLR